MHSCPKCGSACYCGGDIDDSDCGDIEAEDNCTCCDGESEDGDDEVWHGEVAPEVKP